MDICSKIPKFPTGTLLGLINEWMDKNPPSWKEQFLSLGIRLILHKPVLSYLPFYFSIGY